MELDLVLNWIVLKMTKMRGFRNPKVQCQDQTKGSIKMKKKGVRIVTEGSFQNQELENTSLNQCCQVLDLKKNIYF